MSVIEDVHADHGATFVDRAGRRVVGEYGRPERTHRAVRNAAGVIERGYDIRIVTGPDRVAAIEDVLTVTVPETDGAGCFGFLLDEGTIASEAAVYNAEEGDRLLVFLPPGRGDVLGDRIADATVSDATADMAVFGVHGAKATEKIASVLSTGGGAPEPAHAFTRGTMGDEGVTVVASDAPTGEEGYEVVCATEDAPRVFDTLVNRGLNATPFGYRTWGSLTLEAGTPLFEAELRGREPATLTAEGDSDGRRLVGLTPETVPDAGVSVLADRREVGVVTRALESPTLDEPIAFALLAGDATTVETDSGIAAERADLPFVEGSQRSARCPDT